VSGSNQIVTVLAVVWIDYTAYVIRLIKRANVFESKQLRIQIAFAIALPIVGAGLVHWMFCALRTRRLAGDRHHIGEENMETTVGPKARSAEVDLE
jgi:hypothetical protein